MARLLLVAAAAVCSFALTAAQPSLNWGNQLYVNALMRLPYAGIVENIESWQNGNQLKVSYYSGMDTYVFRQDMNVTWQVNPEVTTSSGQSSVPVCVETDGPVTINSYIPSMDGFELQSGDAVQMNDQMCNVYFQSVTTLNQTSFYTMYVSIATNLPVRYVMMGYDSLIGSHFDLYQIDYNNVTVMTEFPAGTFDKPMSTCGGFPGPGASHTNPGAEIARYYPGGVAEGLIGEEYAAYVAKHGKVYTSDVEVRARQMQYHKHAHFVNAHQRRYRVGKESYTVAINFLADHLPEELNARRGRLQSTSDSIKKGNGAAGYHKRNYADADLPGSVDWRTLGAVTPPQDQGICGSCWSFGSTGAIEGAYFLKYNKLKVMAEQELMDCSWTFGNNACDGGEDFRAYQWIQQNGGISFKENYGPYLMQDGYCGAQGKSPDVTLQSYINVTMFDENALMDALSSVGPVSVSIDASHPGLSFYTSGVYYDPACGSGVNDLDHSVLAVGYGTDSVGGDFWIVKNSWSTYWGDQGFIRMSRKNNNCGVATVPTYVVVN